MQKAVVAGNYFNEVEVDELEYLWGDNTMVHTNHTNRTGMSQKVLDVESREFIHSFVE